MRIGAFVRTVGGRRMMLAAGVAAVLLAAAVVPGAPARAATAARSCSPPLVTGVWYTGQSNDYHPVFTLTHDGSYVGGTAELPEHERARAGFSGRIGSVEGTTDGNQLDLLVTWPPKYNGIPYLGWYSGKVIDRRIVDGFTEDLIVDNRATWSGSGPNRSASSCATPISGLWYTAQGNNYYPTFDLLQHGTSVTGTAYLSEQERARTAYRSAVGAVSGTFSGDTVDLVVTRTRANGELVRGRYTGAISGVITNGRSYNFANPSNSVSWTGSSPVRCI